MVLKLILRGLHTKIIFFKKDFADWVKCYIFVEQNKTTMTNTETIKNVGLSISKGEWEGAKWTLTGYPNKNTFRNWDSAYDFENFVKNTLKINGNFDSESCQFYVYFDTKQKATAALNKIEKHFKKVGEMLGL